jgi:hypothetical protein
VGLPAIAALGVQVGRSALEGDANGLEAGGIIDLGWIRSPRLRLEGEVQFMRATLTRFVPLENHTYHGSVFDLTASVAAVWLAGSDQQRLVPYLSAGIGVHALSSAFGVAELDRLYNANPFGVHAGAGVRAWVTPSGRTGMFVEARRMIAENVNTTALRLGGLVFYRDLVRPKTR